MLVFPVVSETRFREFLSLKNGSKPSLLSEIQLSGLKDLNAEHGLYTFVKATTLWLSRTHQDGVALFNVPAMSDERMFINIVKVISRSYMKFALSDVQ